MRTPVYYWQTPRQHYDEAMYDGADALQAYLDRPTIVAKRRDLAIQLKAEGYSTFKCSMILNVSEYQVRKLLAEA